MWNFFVIVIVVCVMVIMGCLSGDCGVCVLVSLYELS